MTNTGFTYISFNINTRRYIVQIDNKRYNKAFRTLKEAVEARDKELGQ